MSLDAVAPVKFVRITHFFAAALMLTVSWVGFHAGSYLASQ